MLFYTLEFVLIYLHLALNLWYPGPSIQCCVGAVVCAVEEIEISPLFRGEGRKICPRRSKIEFYCHCGSKFIITSVVLDIRDRSLLMSTAESAKEAGITTPVPVIIIFCRHSKQWIKTCRLRHLKKKLVFIKVKQRYLLHLISLS